MYLFSIPSLDTIFFILVHVEPSFFSFAFSFLVFFSCA